MCPRVGYDEDAELSLQPQAELAAFAARTVFQLAVVALLCTIVALLARGAPPQADLAAPVMSITNSFPILLNSTNAVQKAAPYYQFRVPFGQGLPLAGRQIALASFQAFISWPNIVSSAKPSYGPNNVFQYIWVDGSTNTVTIPTGGYGISDLTGFLQYTMQQNLHYLIDQNGNPVFFAQFLENVPQDSVTYQTNTVPSSLPTGWTQPVGATWSLPGTPTGVSLVIEATPAGAGFGTLIGFSAGTYPASPPTNPYSVNSSVIPQFLPVSAVQVTADCAVALLSSTSNALYQFAPPSSGYASEINIAPPSLLWVDTVPNTRNYITISLLDQLGNPLQVQDPSCSFMLMLRDKKPSP